MICGRRTTAKKAADRMSIHAKGTVMSMIRFWSLFILIGFKMQLFGCCSPFCLVNLVLPNSEFSGQV